MVGVECLIRIVGLLLALTWMHATRDTVQRLHLRLHRMIEHQLGLQELGVVLF